MNFTKKLFYTNIAGTVRVKSQVKEEPLALHKASKIKKKNNKKILKQWSSRKY